MSSRGYAAVVTQRIDSGEHEIHYIPRTPNGIGVIYSHGAGGSFADVQRSVSKLYVLGQRLAYKGFNVISGDLGGAQTWGNDTVAARLEAARQILIADGCDGRIVLIGGSMGNLSNMRYAADNPANVRCMVGLMPAIDINQLRTNNWAGIKAFIEAAWGIGTSDPIPARGIPQGRVADMSSVPWAAWYSSADTVVDYQDAINMASALGGSSQATEVSSTLEHSDALMAVMPFDSIIAWIENNI